jgi:hypothetical protein
MSSTAGCSTTCPVSPCVVYCCVSRSTVCHVWLCWSFALCVSVCELMQLDKNRGMLV